MTAPTLTPVTRRRVLVGALVLGAFTVGLASGPILDWLSPDGDAPAPGVTLAFAATAYCKGTTTAAGVNVRRGVAAADPKVLPPGTVVRLATGDAEFDGVYTVLDTGPSVQGRLLDLYVWSCNEALDFGRRAVEVTILRLGWDPRASAESVAARLFQRRRIKSPRPPSTEPTAEPDQPAAGAPQSAAGAEPPPAPPESGPPPALPDDGLPAAAPAPAP